MRLADVQNGRLRFVHGEAEIFKPLYYKTSPGQWLVKDAARMVMKQYIEAKQDFGLKAFPIELTEAEETIGQQAIDILCGK